MKTTLENFWTFGQPKAAKMSLFGPKKSFAVENFGKVRMKSKRAGERAAAAGKSRAASKIALQKSSSSPYLSLISCSVYQFFRTLRTLKSSLFYSDGMSLSDHLSDNTELIEENNS